ncbi:MAG TPA: hypothetical protein VE978_25740 [Chitinophagales bacterium]|nr:hypothetical protein [Chitinophagales bacterium]
MKMFYAVIVLFEIGGLVFYLASCNNKSKVNKQTQQQNQDMTKRQMVDPNNNPYTGLRDMALSVTAEQIRVQVPSDQTKIYGVIMDWDLGKGTATLVSFLSGDASLYLSSGGGIIGGVGHDNVHQAAVAFIDKAEDYLSRTIKTETAPLPDKNGVRFYFLTNKGKFVGQEQMKNLDNRSSQWLGLFDEGNKVITELRLSTSNK